MIQKIRNIGKNLLHKKVNYFLLIIIALCMQMHSQAQVLSYKFDDSGSPAKNLGTGGAIFDLGIFNADGASVDLRGQGIGVGKALDFSSATEMGSVGGNNSGPVAIGEKAGEVFNGARSFTITCWYKASVKPRGGARLLEAKNIRILFNDYITFEIDKDKISSNSTVGGAILSATGESPKYGVVGQWIFFAITYVYHADKNQSVVAFYGSDSNSTSLLTSYTVTYTPQSPGLDGLTRLFIGNNGAKGIRPFKGSFDDITVYAAKDSSGVLDAATIGALRLSQLNGK